jgi:homoserine kinase type II
MKVISTPQVEIPALVRNDKQIQSVADFFHLGKVKHFHKVPFGFSNTSFIVEMYAGSKYVIRFIGVWNPKVLENERYVHDELFGYGMLTNRLMRSATNEYVYIKDGVYATASEFINGAHPDPRVPIEDCYRIGAELAKIHIALANKHLPYMNPESFLNEDGIMAQLNRLQPGEYKSKAERLITLSRLQDKRDLPSGIIHADLHPNNVLLTEETIAILDLEHVDEGPFVLDIGRSIADVCSCSSVLDYKKAARFMEGYEKYRTITSKEKALLDKMIIYGAAATGIWFYEYGYQEFADHLLDVGIMAERQMLEGRGLSI